MLEGLWVASNCVIYSGASSPTSTIFKALTGQAGATDPSYLQQEHSVH